MAKQAINHSRVVRITACILAILAVMIVLAIFLSPELAWDGGTSVEVRFHIVEADGNGFDVKGARIELQDYSDPDVVYKYPAVMTDTAGLATVSMRCGAGGSRGIFGTTGNIVISPTLLVVEAEGYHPVSAALANIVGGRRWPLSKRVFDVELLLFKSHNPLSGPIH